MPDSLLDRAPMLPGIRLDDLPAPLTDEQLEALPQHTAARLFELDEARYRLAVALFFGEGMGVRNVCRVCHISCHTLQAIVRRESGSTTADEWRKVCKSDLRATMHLIRSRIDELLQNDEAVKVAGLKGLATLLREHVHAHELLDQRMPGQGDAKPLTPEQQAQLYINAQTQARGQSIEVTEMSEATRGGSDADQDGQEVSNG
jgi:hypothetical protein